MFPVKLFRLFVAMILLCSLTGCSSTNQLYLQSIKLAFFADATTLTLAQVKQSKSDLLKVNHGERAPVYMGLAYIEDKQLKWVSADKAILVFQQDKLFRTSGLDSDLQYTSAFNDYSLSLPDLANQPEWEYSIDIDNQVYDLPMHSTWQVGEPESAVFYDTTLEFIPVKEVVTTQINKPYASHTESWTNIYWFDTASKQIIYSEQKASPFAQTLQMTFVSRIARIIDKRQGNE